METLEAPATIKLHFHFSDTLVNDLTWEEYETFETAQDGDLKLSRLRPLMARFMVDEKLKPIPHPTALKTLGKVPMNEIQFVIKDFMSSIMDAAVPKEKETPSSQPSQPAIPPSIESPDGSQP